MLLSAVRSPVCLSICYSVCKFLLQHHCANFNQTCHNASWGRTYSNKWPRSFPRRNDSEIVHVNPSVFCFETDIRRIPNCLYVIFVVYPIVFMWYSSYTQLFLSLDTIGFRLPSFWINPLQWGRNSATYTSTYTIVNVWYSRRRGGGGGGAFRMILLISKFLLDYF